MKWCDYKDIDRFLGNKLFMTNLTAFVKRVDGCIIVAGVILIFILTAKVCN